MTLKLTRLPNFLYIGPNKSGSTWIYDVLERHPDVYMAPGKGLHFFSSHYQRGLDWYASHFDASGGERIRGEVSHSYLYAEKACERIARLDLSMKLMVCLREPVERAFSEHLHAVKNGRVACSFESQLERDPSLLEHGCYARYLVPYLARFPREQLHVGVFDDLAADPERFARDLFAFLGVEPLPLSEEQRRKMMPAGEPRSRLLRRAAKRVSHALRSLGLQRLRGRLKTSRRVRTLLYRPYAREERPRMRPETRKWLREVYRDDVARLDKLLDGRFRQRWGYR